MDTASDILLRVNSPLAETSGVIMKTQEAMSALSQEKMPQTEYLKMRIEKTLSVKEEVRKFREALETQMKKNRAALVPERKPNVTSPTDEMSEEELMEYGATILNDVTKQMNCMSYKITSFD